MNTSSENKKFVLTEIPMQTLTPLWTGDGDRDSTRVRETGLIGSLRWWYEGIVRGMGGHACDPTGDDRCIFDPDKGRDPVVQLCPACLLFGCTGWKRRFRLEVSGLSPLSLFFVSSQNTYNASFNWLTSSYDPEKSKARRSDGGRREDFSFHVRTLWSREAKIEIVPLTKDPKGIMDQLSFLLNFASRWGGLGAKTQNGFGQVRVSNLGDDRVSAGLKRIKEVVRLSEEKHQGENDPDFLSLSSFFSVLYDLGDRNPYEKSGRLIGKPERSSYGKFFVPCAFDIRYKSRMKNHNDQGENFGMRPWFKNVFGKDTTNLFFGSSESPRSGSMIHVSHLYRSEPDTPFLLKVWGHVPRSVGISVKEVEQEVDKFVQLKFQKEFKLNVKKIEKFNHANREEVLSP